MSDVKITITHNGVDYFARVMRIRETFLGREDHGIWTFVLHCDSSGPSVGIGTYGLDDQPHEPGSRQRRGSAAGMDLIMAVVDVLGVGQWEALKGKPLYGLFEGPYGIPRGIANIDSGKVLIFTEHYQYWKSYEEKVAALCQTPSKKSSGSTRTDTPSSPTGTRTRRPPKKTT